MQNSINPMQNLESLGFVFSQPLSVFWEVAYLVYIYSFTHAESKHYYHQGPNGLQHSWNYLRATLLTGIPLSLFSCSSMKEGVNSLNRTSHCITLFLSFTPHINSFPFLSHLFSWTECTKHLFSVGAPAFGCNGRMEEGCDTKEFGNQ